MQEDDINARVEAEVQRRLAGGGAGSAAAPTPAAGGALGGGFTPAFQATQQAPAQPMPTHLSFCIKFQMPDGSEARGYLHFPIEGINPQFIPQYAVQIAEQYPVETYTPRQQGGYGNQGGYGGGGGYGGNGGGGNDRGGRWGGNNNGGGRRDSYRRY